MMSNNFKLIIYLMDQPQFTDICLILSMIIYFILATENNEIKYLLAMVMLSNALLFFMAIF